jgi:hypothetical protein
MVITKKARLQGYHQDVWYSKDAITNIFALSNMSKQDPDDVQLPSITKNLFLRLTFYLFPQRRRVSIT